MLNKIAASLPSLNGIKQYLGQALGLSSNAPYAPVPVRMLRQLNEHARIFSLLPYLSYSEEEGLFQTDDGIGFCLEVVPQTGANDDMSRVLTGLFASCPVGAGVQIQLYAGNNITELMHSYRAQRIDDEAGEDPNIFHDLARRRSEFYINGSKQPIFPQMSYLLRDFRIALSVSLPGSLYERDKVDNAIMLRDGMLATLKSANFTARVWAAEDLIQWTSRIINLHRYQDYESARWTPYDPGKEIRHQIVDYDALLRVEKQGLLFGDAADYDQVEARFYSVRSYPPKFALWSMRNLLGDYFQAALQYTCPFVITLGVHILDFEKTKAMAQMKSARATTNASSPMAHFLPELQEKKADWDIVMQSLGEGNNMVSLYHQLMLIAPPNRISQAEQAAKAIWRSRSFELTNDTYMQVQALIGSLPMTLSRDFYADLKKAGRVSTKTADNAVALAPLLAEWQGTATPVLTLFGRLGQAMALDVFDNTTGNYNCAIAGVSGTGKSVLLNELALSYRATGAKVWIIDVGRSYEKSCKNLGGEFIEFTSEHDICMNPFTHVEDLEEEMDMLKPLIGQMASPSRPLNDYEKTCIEKAIRNVYRAKGRAMTITDVADYLLNGDSEETGQADPRTRDLGQMLYPYTAEGQYGRYFEGPATIDFDNDFTVLELEELKSKKDLQSVVLLIMMYRITQEMYLSRDRKKVVIIDEAWDLMGGGSTAEFIESGYRRARKYKGSFMTATQAWDDYYKNPAATAALQNSDWTFMLRQKKESIDMLEETKRIAVDEYVKRVLHSIKTEHGKYSEIFINSQMGSGVGRLIVDPFHLLLFSSSADDFNAINAKVHSGMKMNEAIEAVLAERGMI